MGIEPFTGPVDSLSSGLVGIKNSGNLPATNVKWAIQIQLSTDRRWPTPRIYQELEGDNVLAPGAIMRQGSDPIVFAYGNFEEFRISYYIYVYGGSLTLTGSLPDDGQISAIDTTASTLTIRRQPWVAIVSPPIRGDLTGSVTKPDNRAAATTAHDNNLCAAIVAEHRGKAGG